MTAPVLLVTRPEPEASAFAARMRHAPTVISPLQRIEPVATELPAEIAGLVLTSPRAALAAASLPLARGLTVWCTGDRTAEVAREAGFLPRSAAGDAEALAALILGELPEGPLLHLRGEHARGDLAGRLTEGGVPCAERIVYRQVPQTLTTEARAALAGGAPVVAPLFSPRSAQLLAGAGPFAAPLHAVVMSRAVAEAAAALAPAALFLAERPDAAAMGRATRAALEGAESQGPRL